MGNGTASGTQSLIALVSPNASKGTLALKCLKTSTVGNPWNEVECEIDAASCIPATITCDQDYFYINGSAVCPVDGTDPTSAYNFIGYCSPVNIVPADGYYGINDNIVVQVSNGVVRPVRLTESTSPGDYWLLTYNGTIITRTPRNYPLPQEDVSSYFALVGWDGLTYDGNGVIDAGLTIDQVTILQPYVPQPIAPVGAVQVFADEQCTRYADGQSATVYVRLNRAFGYGDYKSWGHPDYPGQVLQVFTRTAEWPDDGYSIMLWVDWTTHEREQPFVAGEVIECYNGSSTTVSNPTVIFYDE